MNKTICKQTSSTTYLSTLEQSKNKIPLTTGYRKSLKTPPFTVTLEDTKTLQ